MSVYYEHFKATADGGKGNEGYYARFKTGNGLEDMGTIYKAMLNQRGYGLRDFDEINGYGFWQDLWAMGKPLLTKGLKYFGSKAVDTVANVAQDAIAGKNVEESVRSRVAEAKDDVVAQVPGAITSMLSGRSKKRGTSYKGASRKRKAISQHSVSGLSRAKKEQRTFPGLKYL